jgi:Holliday junction resolvasome RuvABC endonuclease subunit
MTISNERFVWGVDPALSRFAFAFAALDANAVEVETLTTHTDARDGERFALLDRQLRAYARQAARWYPPACVWVEQPSGHWRIPQLSYAVRVAQAALYEALGAPVWLISSGAWKRRTVGNGASTKPQVRAWVDRLGVGVDSQHEADAVAIAVAGRAMLTTGCWEAAA